MDINKIKKLIEMLKDTDVAEIEIQEKEGTLKLIRYAQGGPLPMVQTFVPAVSTAPMAPVVDTAATESEATSSSHKLGHVVRSPMVGTYYSSSAPDTPPFAQVGKRVKQGDTLGIIEAMKMFNEVEADKAGVIIEVLVKNGSPVEYDQPLFIIE